MVTMETLGPGHVYIACQLGLILRGVTEPLYNGRNGTSNFLVFIALYRSFCTQG